jgi:hypothetical protein
MRKNLFLLILFFTLFTYTYSQKAPIKFGVVSMDELQMTSTYIDTTAPAVVLCDYGFFRASDLTFTRTVRIKILKKEGYNWANKSFQSDFKSSLRGMTTNLEDGKIVQEKLHNDAIYSTRLVDDFYVLSPAMPNVKVGSVIDLEFTFRGFPTEWRFQEEIPVAYSELNMEERPGLTFRTNFFGYEKLTYSTSTRWIARDMPAFKTEPYMSSIENFITKMKLDLANFSRTWEKIDELLILSPYFGMPTESTLFLNALSHNLSEKYKNQEDLLKTAFDTVRKSIVWNDNIRLTSEDGNLASVYKMKVGNSAEVNMILYKLLKKLDFDVKPVALSTRENGTLSQYNPSVRQLNYFIVCVKLGDRQILLDATEKYMPYYLLPLRCLNVQARLVDKTNGAWLNVTNSKKNKDLAIEELKFDNDLTLKGSIKYIRNDYSAFDFRKKYSKYNSQDEYIEEYAKNMPGLVIKDVKIDDLDSIYKPVSENLTVEIKNQVNPIDNNLYLFPSFFEELKENPFKSENRKYPIDFGIPFEKTLILNLTVPEGYAAGTLPQSVAFRMEDNAASFLFKAESENNIIRLTTKFSVNKILFLPDEYGSLKEFYNQVMKKQSEPIVLKKI